MKYLLPHSIERAAEKSPSRDAFRCQGKGITYEELAGKSSQLAHHLIESGVRKGDRVGVYMQRSLESAVAVYGIMKAGGAFVPIDPLAPASAVRKIIAHCGIRHLVSHPPMANTLRQLLEDEETARRVECVAGFALEGAPPGIAAHSWEEIEGAHDRRAPELRLTEQDVAYIMYTSGSTGEPKGIIHTHHSGLSYAALSAATYGIRPEDRIGSHSPLHFDMSTLGYLTGPWADATTILIPEAHTKLPASLSQLMEQERVSIWYSVPFALVQLLRHGALDERDLTAIRWVLYGGEPFPPQHLYALMKIWNDARFSNVYGPAEVNQCTYYHVPAPAENASAEELQRPIPIGQVWDNTEGMVVDETNQPVAPGESGELLIRSPTMMQGYFGRPDLDVKAFHYTEIAPNLTATWYRTGDLVRMDEDGNHHFLGRKDRQVKIRGYRIELGDVENALARHPDVETAAVFPVNDAQGSMNIEAAVVPRSDSVPDEKKLSAHLSEHLPRYALPSRILIVEAFPRTGAGKIDYRKLQAGSDETPAARSA